MSTVVNNYFQKQGSYILELSRSKEEREKQHWIAGDKFKKKTLKLKIGFMNQHGSCGVFFRCCKKLLRSLIFLLNTSFSISLHLSANIYIYIYIYIYICVCVCVFFNMSFCFLVYGRWTMINWLKKDTGKVRGKGKNLIFLKY